MSFKQNWGMIWQEKAMIYTLAIIGIILGIVFFSTKDYIVSIVLLLGTSFLVLMMVKVLRLPGHLTDEVHIDEEGISLKCLNKDDTIIKWSNLKSLVKTRKHGTNALAAIAQDDTLIWFYTNGEIEQAIIKYYPEAKKLFVKNNHFSLYGM